MKLKTLTDISW